MFGWFTNGIMLSRGQCILFQTRLMSFMTL